MHYCASPAEHGHTVRTFGPPPAAGTTPRARTRRAAAPAGRPGWRRAAGSGPAAGDRGEQGVGGAAGEVRRRWLPQLFARRAAPREVARFVARQLLTMPEPLRLGLAAAPPARCSPTSPGCTRTRPPTGATRPGGPAAAADARPDRRRVRARDVRRGGPQHLAGRPLQPLPAPGRRAVPGVPGQHRLPAHRSSRPWPTAPHSPGKGS